MFLLNEFIAGKTNQACSSPSPQAPCSNPAMPLSPRRLHRPSAKPVDEPDEIFSASLFTYPPPMSTGERVVMRTSLASHVAGGQGTRHSVTRSTTKVTPANAPGSGQQRACNHVNKSPVRLRKITDVLAEAETPVAGKYTSDNYSNPGGNSPPSRTAVVGPRKAIVIALPSTDNATSRTPAAIRVSTRESHNAQHAMSQSISGELMRTTQGAYECRPTATTTMTSATLGRTPRGVRRSFTALSARTLAWDAHSPTGDSLPARRDHPGNRVLESFFLDQDQTASQDEEAHVRSAMPGMDGKATPSGFRRSGVTAQCNTSKNDDQQQMPAKTNKMIVAPQQQHSPFSHAHGDEDSHRGETHCTVVQRRRGSYGVMPVAPVRASGTRNVDSPLTTFYYHQMDHANRGYIVESPGGDCDEMARVTTLEQRVRELETAIASGNAQSTASLVIPVPMGNVAPMRNSLSCGRLHAAALQAASASTQQQLLAADIVDKEVEIERLSSQLRKCYTKMEMRQVQYEEEVKCRRGESELARSQLAAVKNRLNELEAECAIYKDKAAAVEQQRQVVLNQTQEKMLAQEKELNVLRGELDKAAVLVDELTAMKRDLEWMELQNEALSTSLDCKEQEVRELNDAIATMAITEKVDEEDEDSERTPTHRRRHPPACTQATTSISPAAIAAIRAQQQKMNACRYTAKCLRDTASRLARGEPPNINRLLACRDDGDSMSESEVEERAETRGEMSSMAVENALKGLDTKMSKVEADLEAIRQLFADHYAKQMAGDFGGSKNCAIQ